jgi:hypothetical protein
MLYVELPWPSGESRERLRDLAKMIILAAIVQRAETCYREAERKNKGKQPTEFFDQFALLLIGMWNRCLEVAEIAEGDGKLGLKLWNMADCRKVQ